MLVRRRNAFRFFFLNIVSLFFHSSNRILDLRVLWNNSCERHKLYPRSVAIALKFCSEYGEIPPKTPQLFCPGSLVLVSHNHWEPVKDVHLPSLLFSAEKTWLYNRPVKLQNFSPDFTLSHFFILWQFF